MSLLSKEELTGLIQKPKGICVSVYLPTHRAGAEIKQDPIRLKNLIRIANERLTEAGVSSQDVHELLAPMEKFLWEGLFWQHQSDGLAIFSSAGFFRYYRLPYSFDELVVVTDRFHIKPLLSLLTGDGRFYILALSQNRVRLLQGTRHSVSEIDLEDVPASLAEALRYDDPERQLQFHTGVPTGKGKRAAIFHGHGVGIDDAKVNILRYFRQIDQGLSGLLKGEQIPLILVGVDYLHPIYREANTYPYLISDGVLGNPDKLKADEIHKRAWAVIEPKFKKQLQDATARYKQLLAGAQASSDLKKVIPAAYHGQVDILFVAVGIQSWGKFIPETNRMEIRKEAEAGDEDLLDFAAIHTFLHGGTVYAITPQQVPDKASAAAVFRY
jgi:hypothetical protein